MTGEVLTVACRFTPKDHENCAGHIYLGSIFGEPSTCQCQCHQDKDAA